VNLHPEGEFDCNKIVFKRKSKKAMIFKKEKTVRGNIEKERESGCDLTAFSFRKERKERLRSKKKARLTGGGGGTPIDKKGSATWSQLFL